MTEYAIVAMEVEKPILGIREARLVTCDNALEAVNPVK
jgi:hypothetical protein